MKNDELFKYINECRENNVSEEDIKRELLKVGWPETDVNESLDYQVKSESTQLIKGKKILPIILIILITILLILGFFITFYNFYTKNKTPNNIAITENQTNTYETKEVTIDTEKIKKLCQKNLDNLLIMVRDKNQRLYVGNEEERKKIEEKILNAENELFMIGGKVEFPQKSTNYGEYVIEAFPKAIKNQESMFIHLFFVQDHKLEQDNSFCVPVSKEAEDVLLQLLHCSTSQQTDCNDYLEKSKFLGYYFIKNSSKNIYNVLLDHSSTARYEMIEAFTPKFGFSKKNIEHEEVYYLYLRLGPLAGEKLKQDAFSEQNEMVNEKNIADNFYFKLTEIIDSIPEAQEIIEISPGICDDRARNEQQCKEYQDKFQKMYGTIKSQLFYQKMLPAVYYMNDIKAKIIALSIPNNNMTIKITEIPTNFVDLGWLSMPIVANVFAEQQIDEFKAGKTIILNNVSNIEIARESEDSLIPNFRQTGKTLSNSDVGKEIRFPLISYDLEKNMFIALSAAAVIETNK